MAEQEINITNPEFIATAPEVELVISDPATRLNVGVENAAPRGSVGMFARMSDIITLKESISILWTGPTAPILDIANPAETVGLSVGKVFGDTVARVEVFSKIIGKNINETVTRVELFIKAIDKGIAETVTAVERYSVNFSTPSTDITAVTDETSFGVSIVSSDTVVDQEEIVKDIGKGVAETVTRTETFVKSMEKVLEEVTSAVETFSYFLFTAYTQAVNDTGTVSEVKTYYKQDYLTDPHGYLVSDTYLGTTGSL
jgi:hypothetical protein